MTDDALRTIAALPGVRVSMFPNGASWCVTLAWNDGPANGVVVHCADPIEALTVASARAEAHRTPAPTMPDDLAELLG